MPLDNPLEKTIQKNVQKYLDSRDIFWYHPSSMHAKGTPDILACYRGMFLGIELKRPKGGVVSALQERKMKLIRASGGMCAVCHSVEEVAEFLASVDKEIA